MTKRMAQWHHHAIMERKHDKENDTVASSCRHGEKT